ncbi:MAG TPA: T9SS type A sorting domain-containing protein [Candidatus Kapabacteria bacterium]|nr:T9SS type A sorting domain-containing protein [Candidatus Kapabacteria bacterium]
MRSLPTICTILLIASISLLSQEIKHYEQFNKEDKKEHKEYLKKLQYDMYHTEPGVNNRVVEDELKKYFRDMRNTKHKSEKLLSSEFAWGRLVGTWKERGSNNNAGRTHVVELSNDQTTLYVGSSGGNIWRGTIDGKNWVCLNNTFKFNDIQDIKVFEDQSNNRRIMISENKKVYYSDDNGQYWQACEGLESLENWGSILRTMTVQKATGGHRIFVLTQDFNYKNWYEIRKLLASDDYGQTFTEITNFDPITTVDIWGDRNTQNLYMQVKDTLYSIDSDLNVTALAHSQFIKDMLSVNHNVRMTGSIINSQPVIYYAVTQENSNRMILKYYPETNEIAYQGETTTNMFMSNSFAVSKVDPNLLWIGGVETFYSTDAGANWNLVNKWGEYYKDVENKLHADIPGINTFRVNNSNSELVFVNTDGGTYIGTGLPNKFKNISMNGLNVSQIYSTYTYDGSAGEFVYVGCQDQGFQIGNISGESTVRLEQDISGDYGAISSSDGGKNVWSVYPGYLLYYSSLPFGRYSLGWNFTGQYNDRVWMPAVAAMPFEPTKAVIAPGGSNNTSKLFVVNYDGSQLKVNELPYQFDSQEADNDVSALAISPIDNQIWYVATKKGRFYTSTNSGKNWTEAVGFAAPGYNYLHPTPIIPSKINKDVVFVGGAGYNAPGVYASYDGGTTFEALGDDMPKAFFYDFDLTADEKAIFAATSVGPYIYIFAANRWFPIIDENTPDQVYWSVNYIERTKTARFATYGRGIWDFKIENLVTSVGDKPTVKHNTVRLYPNPAQDFVNIDFSKVESTINSARIFDIDGNLILDLKASNFNTENPFKWDMTNSQGYKVNNGAYLLVYIVDGNNYYEKINISR